MVDAAGEEQHLGRVDKVVQHPTPARLTEQPQRIRAQHQIAWEAKRKELDEVRDRKGLGIDEGIKETVVAFNMLGLNTVASCEGHPASEGHGDQTPWIDVSAPGRPKIRYGRQMEVIQQVAHERGLSLDDVLGRVDEATAKAYGDALKQASANGYTDEFTEWMRKSSELGERAEQYIDEFYASREVPANVRLTVDEIFNRQYRIACGDQKENIERHLARMRHETIDEVPDMLLLERKAEMAAFTDFLREKYFLEDEATDAHTDNPQT